jgi:hypothetical protein
VRASGTARVTKGKGDGSPAARLDALEHNFEGLQTEFDAFRQDSQKEARELRAGLDAEQQARALATRNLSQQLENQAVGSADLQLVGLVWFAAGTIYATLPDLLAPLLRLAASSP